MQISEFAANMEYSPIRKFNAVAAKAAAEGAYIYHLNIGQPDIPTPSCFHEAIRNFDSRIVAYAESQGDERLIHAIQRYFAREYDIAFKENEIIATMGASEALTMTFTTLLNYREEVLIPEPFYSNYQTFVTAASGRVRPITTTPETGYDYADRELLERSVTPNTKAIVCINPGNPTGNVLTPEDMELLADFAIKHDLWIIADEAYREYVYDGRKACTFASVERIADRLILIDSVSKRFSACGARIGCVISRNEEFMDAILKLAQARLCIPTVDQLAAAALFDLDSSYYEKMRAEYEERRDAAYEEMIRIPGAVCKKPGGAFYMSIDLPIDDAEDFLMFMLTEFRYEGETTMFAPAKGFYSTPGKGTTEIRIAYVLNSADLRRACHLIRLGVAAYTARRALTA